MAEQPPLNRFYVASYAANDKDFPILAVRLDPRVAGYRVPEDLSSHPDSKRYPNHVFTGSQPSNGDERVTHIYEILPSPWVPFTRYDDDLGPVQGRRRSVKNEGQVASLAADKRVNYEAREGSAIVYTEIEETWSIETDDDGNSLFPVRDRDFYDASRGSVQERRQLFVPTGEEEGTLENVNGVITQTSYEPYNEFLSVKIVQTYSVNGPQLIGKATDNDGQLVTVTTQRKGADGYIPPNPTATRTVEVSREDAESLVERVVDTPEIFTAKTFSLERPDPIPQKFRVAVPLQSEQEVVAGEAELPTLLTGEISRTEEQRNKFLKRTTATSRDQTVLPKTLIQKATNNERQEVTITETLQLGDTDEVPTATKTVESEALGDGNFVVRKTEVPEVFSGETYRKVREDITPQKFKAAQEDTVFEQTIAGIADPNITLGEGEFAKSEEQINNFVKRVSTTSRAITSAFTLYEKVLTQDGQIGSRVLTLDVGDQSFVPSALLVDASVEALGDGRTVKSETTVPTVFAGKTVQKSRIDLTPEKFRAKQEDTTTEETVAGTVDPNISLGTGEFRKSEQQVTQFVKRISTNSRDISAADTLTETVITPQGQIATRTLRLFAGEQSIQPDALLVDGSVEALGDGRTIKTETKVPNVFTGKTISVNRPDPVPEKFRIAIPSFSEEQALEGVVNPNLQLLEGQFAKSEQQVTEFVKRVSVTSRNLSEPKTISGLQYTTELGGGFATITETYPYNDLYPSSPQLGTLSDEIQDLGDGTKLRRTVRLVPRNRILGGFGLGESNIDITTLPTLVGQEYDEELDIVIPYTQVTVSPNSRQLTLGDRRRTSPRDVAHSVVQRYEIGDIQQSLDDYYWEIPDMVSITLPDKLISARVGTSFSGGTANGGGGGDTYHWSASGTSSRSSSVIWDIEEGFSGNIPTIRCIFFLPKGNSSPEDVLRKIREKRENEEIAFWPNARPQAHELVTFNQSSGFNASQSVSFDSSSFSDGTNYSFTIDKTTIPATIHPTIIITSGAIGTTTTTTPTAPIFRDFTNSETLRATSRPILDRNMGATSEVSPSRLEATEPYSRFPTGEFIYQINASPYKFSYTRVDALLVNITEDYV